MTPQLTCCFDSRSIHSIDSLEPASICPFGAEPELAGVRSGSLADPRELTVVGGYHFEVAKKRLTRRYRTVNRLS